MRIAREGGPHFGIVAARPEEKESGLPKYNKRLNAEMSTLDPLVEIASPPNPSGPPPPKLNHSARPGPDKRTTQGCMSVGSHSAEHTQSCLRVSSFRRTQLMTGPCPSGAIHPCTGCLQAVMTFCSELKAEICGLQVRLGSIWGVAQHLLPHTAEAPLPTGLRVCEARSGH
jgi:hypothetical protein